MVPSPHWRLHENSRSALSAVGVVDCRSVAGSCSEREDADSLLHLSCDVEPVNEYGWVDYYVHNGVCPVDAMDAKELVRTAVRQWGMARKPDYFVAQVASDR